jgi:hypothetical protein
MNIAIKVWTIIIILVIILISIPLIYATNLSSEAKITALRFNLPNTTINYVGIINEYNKSIRVSVPSGVDMSEAVPYAIISNGASIDFCQKNADKLNETSSMIYTVTSIDGTTQNYTVIISREQSKSALFDIILDILSEPDAKNKNLTIKVSLINFGSSNTVNADLIYSITDNNNVLLKQINRNIPVTTQMEFIDNIDTGELLEGKYILQIELKYAGQEYPAKTEKTFNVVKKKTLIDNIKNLRNTQLASIVMAVLSVIALTVVYIKKHNQTSYN